VATWPRSRSPSLDPPIFSSPVRSRKLGPTGSNGYGLTSPFWCSSHPNLLTGSSGNETFGSPSHDLKNEADRCRRERAFTPIELLISMVSRPSVKHVLPRWQNSTMTFLLAILGGAALSLLVDHFGWHVNPPFPTWVPPGAGALAVGGGAAKANLEAINAAADGFFAGLLFFVAFQFVAAARS
jgi:hypothetical protein